MTKPGRLRPRSNHRISLRYSDSTSATVYDSYGQISQDTGGIAQPYAFTGREFDAESDLYFYRARYYDPATGRFLSEDPLGFGAGDPNLYRYVVNNPVNLRDPSGKVIPLAIGAAACLGGGLGNVLGGAVGTGAGGAARAIIDATLDDMEQRRREADDRGSNKPCGEPNTSPAGDGPDPSDFPTPTPADFLKDAALNFLLGCGVGVTAVVVATNPVTITAAAAAGIAGAAGAAEGIIFGAAGPLFGLFN